jgi:Zn-dependent peptidase ImmA (M78 family)/DNA-binding XRE family transcriptional regulator
MARVEALVNPALLAWARAEAGLDPETAARKAAVRVERLQAWEQGDDRPTVNQVRTLARIYKRPVAVFYLPEPPPPSKRPRDFRRLPGDVAGTESAELRYEIRRAGVRRAIALELLAEEGEEPRSFGAQAELDDDPERVGEALRRVLNVSPSDQRSWRDPYDSFNGWRAAIEDAGALVLQMTDVELEEARGFSLADIPLPVVVANIKDAPVGRVFTLLHEFAHLALRQDGVCDLDDVSARGAAALRIERFCNAVAGAALVPSKALLGQQLVRAHVGVEWTSQELRSLAAGFGVSREVVLRRLRDLGLTSDAFYGEKREEFLEEYAEARARRGGGFAPPHQVALASVGPAFAGLVLSSYSHGHITASDVSDYLGVRLKHLPRIQEQLLSRGRR